LADAIRAAARTSMSLGSGERACAPAEAMNVVPSRRGLYATRTLSAGDCIREEDVIALRPASGLDPERRSELIGTMLTRSIDAGLPFVESDIDSLSQKDRRGVA
jgi:N-acetylneuraminate synthase/N,N'-diacetyllegionaminate synthase